MARPVSRRPSSRPSPGLRLYAAIAVLVVAVAWILWPSKYSKVTNLASRGTSIIAFGDSLTAGYGANKGEDYPSRLSSALGVTIVNAGVSGDTTDDAMARLDQNVLARDPRIVIVGLGGNDFMRGVPLSTTDANLRTIIRRIQAAGAMVVVLGFRFPSLNMNYDKMYKKVAEDEHALFIPDLLDGILANPSLKSDEIHPNGRGYQLMADRIAGPTKKLIAKANAKR